MKNKPLVSVVIPIYNSAATIRETLDSVAAQTYKNKEVICVDDGSTDESVKVINQYISENNDLIVRLIKRETKEKGGSVCRNIGAHAANGKYLIFLDADDLLGNTCLEKRVETIDGSSNQFVVFPMAAFVNNDLSTSRIYSRLHVKEPLYMFLSGFGTWQVTSPIIRKTFFERIGGFDESFPRLQDVEFHIRAIVESNGMYEIKRNILADCFYRQGGNTDVVVEKLKRTIEGCKKLITLIKMYAEKDIFKSKNKFSLSLLSLYCHLSIYQDKIIIYDPKYVRINPVFESDLIKYLTKTTKLFICILDHIKILKLRLFICRFLDKCLRKLLSK